MEGLFVRAKFDRTSKRTVTPREGGKQFEPFTRDVLHLNAYGGEVTYTVEYETGTMPAEYATAEAGDLIDVPVRVRGFFAGRPQLDGKSEAA